jgi:MFS family permease
VVDRELRQEIERKMLGILQGLEKQRKDTTNLSLAVAIMLFAFSMVSYFDRTIMSIAGPNIMSEFHLSATQMGTVFSAFTLGYAVLMIPCGVLTDRLGPRRTLFAMGIGSAAFTGLLVVAGHPGLATLIGILPALIVLRFGMGVVTAPLYPAAARMIATWFPVDLHARVQGFIIAGSSVFAWMMMRFQWRGSFLIAAAITTALALVFLVTIPSKKLTMDGQLKTYSWSGLFGDRNLMLLTYAYCALGYFQYIFFYWIFYYFGQIRHLGAQQSAKYTTILFIVEGLLMPAGGWLSDRLTRNFGPQIGRRVVPISGLALSAVFTYLGTVMPWTAAVVACLSLAFGMAACCEGPFWAAVTEMAGPRIGAASSVLNTGAQVGGVFSPILTPLIASRFGWSWGLYAGALIALSGMLAVYFVDVRPKGIREPLGFHS